MGAYGAEEPPHGFLRGDAYRQLVLPVIVAPMFLVSGPELVVSASQSGVIGTFPSVNARTLDELASWLEEVRASVKPGDLWGVSLVAHKTYDRFEAELELIKRTPPPMVISALGNPRRIVEGLAGVRSLILADVISVHHAQKAIDSGAGGLVLVSSGAGGHTGKCSPFAFVDEVRRFWSGPLVLAGGVGTGRGVRAALSAGADFVSMGTRFLASMESAACEGHKDVVIRAGVDGVIVSKAISGVPACWLVESLERAGYDLKLLDAGAKVDFSRAEGPLKPWKDVWSAGHGVGAVKQRETVSEIVARLRTEFAGPSASELRWCS